MSRASGPGVTRRATARPSLDSPGAHPRVVGTRVPIVAPGHRGNATEGEHARTGPLEDAGGLRAKCTRPDTGRARVRPGGAGHRRCRAVRSRGAPPEEQDTDCRRLADARVDDARSLATVTTGALRRHSTKRHGDACRPLRRDRRALRAVPRARDHPDRRASDEYVYSGGWAHRDWPTLLAALEKTGLPAVDLDRRIDSSHRRT